VKINPNSVIKPLHKIVADHKDVVKINLQLNGIVSTIKPETTDLLTQFAIYSELWDVVSDQWGPVLLKCRSSYLVYFTPFGVM
jgi:hypothetical protein